VLHKLTFSVLHTYDAGEPGITLPVRLSNGADFVDLLAKLDTGASHCIFQRNYAESLGIDVETGEEKKFGTANSSFIAYGHEARITALDFRLDLKFDATVYFAKDYDITRNVLGRQGWLNRIRLGLIDYDSKLYVSHYDDDSYGEA
jgi:hypothetical protein